jgi:hypothetical protein
MMKRAFWALLAVFLWVASLVDIRHRGYLAGFHDGVKQAVFALEANVCKPGQAGKVGVK